LIFLGVTAVVCVVPGGMANITAKEKSVNHHSFDRILVITLGSKLCCGTASSLLQTHRSNPTVSKKSVRISWAMLCY